MDGQIVTRSGIFAKPFKLLFKQLVVEFEINLIIALYVYVTTVIVTLLNIKKNSLDLSQNQTLLTTL